MNHESDRSIDPPRDVARVTVEDIFKAPETFGPLRRRLRAQLHTNPDDPMMLKREPKRTYRTVVGPIDSSSSPCRSVMQWLRLHDVSPDLTASRRNVHTLQFATSLLTSDIDQVDWVQVLAPGDNG